MIARLPTIAALVAALPSGVFACSSSFGGLDTHNTHWEATLGITFDNPVVKASSMNGRCWIQDQIEVPTLEALARDGIDQTANAVVYRVPGIRITPDYATYSDERDAYQYGLHDPLGQDVFRIVIVAATPANIKAIRGQLSTRTITGPAGGDEPTENTAGRAEFGGIEVEIFSARVKTGLLGGGLTQSAAMFTAPGNPGLLVVFLGDRNSETDRIGGIPLEETLHQTLRDMKSAGD